MSTLSDLALKGHFEELKNKFEKKGMAKAGKNQDSLLKALKKAVATIEDIYEKYPASFTKEHKNNYQSLIQTLLNNGSSYNGHPDIMNSREGKIPSKKPMQKAGKKSKAATSKKRKTG